MSRSCVFKGNSILNDVLLLLLLLLCKVKYKSMVENFSSNRRVFCEGVGHFF